MLNMPPAGMMGMGPGGMGMGMGPGGMGMGMGSGAGGGSPEEILAMLEQIQRMGGNLENAPPELAALLQQVKQSQGQPADDTPTEEITPEPGFVVKTQDEAGRKVFINMVGHPRVAAPGNWSSGMVPDEVQQALDNVDNLSDAEAEALRFPLSMSPGRSDLDKKGEPATCYDCCLNADVIRMCGLHRPLKVFIIELALNWINHKHKQQLDPKYKLPKMRYKGDEVESHRIRVDKKQLVTQVRDVPDEPVFPLVTRKLPPGRLPGSTAPPSAALPPANAATGAGAGAGETAGTAGAVGGTSGFSFARGGQCFRQLGAPQLLGKPVDRMLVEVEVPDKLATQLRGAGGGAAGAAGAAAGVLDSLRVEVAGQQVWVSAPGCQELTVSLPLAATEQGATVQVDTTRTPFPVLQLHLPYMSVTRLAQLAAAQAPHAPGSLGLSSTTTALELEP